MYGSIHTHVESSFDTGNTIKKSIKNFISAGIKKVAITEHGVMSSYEDLKDAVNKLKGDGDIPENTDISIIPGVEGYFGENNAHLILIAKDYQGYLDLCKVVTESNEYKDENGNYPSRPMITWENLEKNITKGHVMCTSACIAGPFGRLFGLEEENLRNKIEQRKASLDAVHYFENKPFVDEYETNKIEYNEKKTYLTKTALSKAEKELKTYHKNGGEGNSPDYEEFLRNRARAEELDTYINENKGKYDNIINEFKTNKNLTKEVNEYNKYIQDLQTLQNTNKDEKALEMYKHFENIFGHDDFYFEIQNHDIPIEKSIYNNVIRLAYSVNAPLIASNDIHICATKDQEEERKALEERRNVAQFLRFGSYMPPQTGDNEYYIKDDNELREWLLKIVEPVDGHSPEEIVDSAIGNIEKSLSKCNVEIEKNTYYPKFAEDENALFEQLVREGIKKHFPNGFPDDRYEKRLEYEIDIIKKMGYAGYHLIVQDYLEYGRYLGYLPTAEEIENAPEDLEELKKYIEEKGYKKIGYSIGPGRGSAAGSLCCYALGITDLDPIKYNLLFERFLNVERVSMPDIDSDFRTDIRDKVESYCKTKYGFDNVAKIMTKTYLSTKGAIRTAARYLGSIQYKKDKEMGKEIPNDVTDYLRTKGWYNKADRLSKSFTEEDMVELTDDICTDEIEKDIVKLSNKLLGLYTTHGQHAAGVIISSVPIRNVIPEGRNENGKMETQCNKKQVEKKGLLKMDFLGLDNLVTITNILQHPLDGKDDWNLQDPILRNKMLEDPEIFKKIFATGLTNGVFQFESAGMKSMLKKFEPESFEDIILLVAAYRPGPMAFISEMIDWKWYNKAKESGQSTWKHVGENGEVVYMPIDTPPASTITLKNEALQKILTPTYGCPVYQEQVMQIFQEMGGYSLGGADLVRRAMSDKNDAEINKQHDIFIYGDEKKGIPGAVKKHGLTVEEADKLFEQLKPFGKYGFNKSHAAAYSLVAMFTAYQKLYHTLDFYKETLNADRTNYDKYDKIFEEMKIFGRTIGVEDIKLLPPDIMKSDDNFTIDEKENGIRFGFKSIKGFSFKNKKDGPETGMDSIIRTTNIMDFVHYNPGVSDKVLINFAKMGVFDSCWSFKNDSHKNAEKQRVNNNRHEVLRWIDKNINTVRKGFYQSDKVKALETKLVNTEDMAEKESILKSITKEKTVLSELNKTIQQNINQDYYIMDNDLKHKSSIPVVYETNDEILETRSWETEGMRTSFAINSSMSLISNCPNKHTFMDLKNDYMEIPAIVISVSDAKKTKNGKEYYNVTLMDRNGETITRRLDMKLKVSEGIFKIPPEDKKFFNIKVDKDIHNVPVGSRTIQKAVTSSKELVNNIQTKNGKMTSGENIGGFRMSTVSIDPIDNTDSHDEH